MFHRIDTELTNREWRGVFGRFANESVLVVATEVMPAREVPGELLNALRRRGGTRAGWTRTGGAFESLWRRTHRGTRLQLGDLDGWMLEPR